MLHSIVSLKGNPMIRKIMGTVLITLGLLGCILPVMPGLIFLFPGLAMISPTWETQMKEAYNSYTHHKILIRLISQCIKSTLGIFVNFLSRPFRK